eukprot:350110-Chlamydomonas_euryale.AAC.1
MVSVTSDGKVWQVWGVAARRGLAVQGLVGLACCRALRHTTLHPECVAGSCWPGLLLSVEAQDPTPQILNPQPQRPSNQPRVTAVHAGSGPQTKPPLPPGSRTPGRPCA